MHVQPVKGKKKKVRGRLGSKSNDIVRKHKSSLSCDQFKKQRTAKATARLVTNIAFTI